MSNFDTMIEEARKSGMTEEAIVDMFTMAMNKSKKKEEEKKKIHPVKEKIKYHNGVLAAHVANGTLKLGDAATIIWLWYMNNDEEFKKIKDTKMLDEFMNYLVYEIDNLGKYFLMKKSIEPKFAKIEDTIRKMMEGLEF